MSNNKFQKFVKKLFSIEDEPVKYRARVMTDAERKEYFSPENIALRKRAIEEGDVIWERIESQLEQIVSVEDDLDQYSP